MGERDKAKIEMQLPDSVVQPIIESEVQAAIVRALEGKEELLRIGIANALQMRVDKKGEVSRYDSDNKVPSLEWLASDAVRRCAIEAVREWAEKQRPAIVAEVVKQLERKKKTLARLMVAGFSESLKSDFRLNVSVEPQPGEEWYGEAEFVILKEKPGEDKANG